MGASFFEPKRENKKRKSHPAEDGTQPTKSLKTEESPNGLCVIVTRDYVHIPDMKSKPEHEQLSFVANSDRPAFYLGGYQSVNLWNKTTRAQSIESYCGYSLIFGPIKKIKDYTPDCIDYPANSDFPFSSKSLEVSGATILFTFFKNCTYPPSETGLVVNPEYQDFFDYLIPENQKNGSVALNKIWLEQLIPNSQGSKDYGEEAYNCFLRKLNEYSEERFTEINSNLGFIPKELVIMIGDYDHGISSTLNYR